MIIFELYSKYNIIYSWINYINLDKNIYIYLPPVFLILFLAYNTI